MTNSTLSKTVESFLKYSFKGNGEYKKFENGSRRSKNSDFTNFKKNNEGLFEVKSGGNNAPRGGKIGEFVVVDFNEKFYEKFSNFFIAEFLRSEASAKEKNERDARHLENVNNFKIFAAENKDMISLFLLKITETWTKSNSRKRKKCAFVAKCLHTEINYDLSYVFDSVISYTHPSPFISDGEKCIFDGKFEII